MTRAAIVIVVCAALQSAAAASAGMAQAPERSRGATAFFGADRHAGFFFGQGPGIFFGQGRGFGSPFFHTGPIFSGRPLIFGAGPARLRGTRDLSDPDGFHYAAGPGQAGFIYGPASGYADEDSDWSFVEEWKDRDPIPAANSLGDSILLEADMGEDEVMARLGSPTDRIRLADREIWKYSGYSLLFESGKLKEIR